MLYLAAVVIAARYLGRWPSILTAVLSVVVFDFFLVPPRHTLAVADTQYLLTFAGLLIVGLVISSLTSQARDQAQAAQSRESQAVALYEFSRDLGSAGERSAILDATIAHVARTFRRNAAIYLPGPDKKLVVTAATPDFTPGVREAVVAEWAFQHDQPAGRGTGSPAGNHDVVSAAANAARRRWACWALHRPPGTRSSRPTSAGCWRPSPARQPWPSRGRSWRNAPSRRTCWRPPRSCYSALLNSISHDLRTPLVTITGAFSSLETAAGRLDEDTRTSLARAGREEAERLNQPGRQPAGHDPYRGRGPQAHRGTGRRRAKRSAWCWIA